jgi:hypothetical protein
LRRAGLSVVVLRQLALLGAFASGLVDYRMTESLRNQTIGLDIVSLFVGRRVHEGAWCRIRAARARVFRPLYRPVPSHRAHPVECDVGEAKAAVRWELDDAGGPVRATGVRPFPTGKGFVDRRWGGDFGNYRDFAGTRVPSVGEAWWDLPEGRFVYWRGRVTALELLAR